MAEMQIKTQKMARSVHSNLTFRTFSPRETYREGRVKSASCLQETNFQAATLRADDVEGLSRS